MSDLVNLEVIKMVTVAISGFAGAGKSTAARALAEKFDLKYVSAGQVFREMARENDMDLIEFSDYVEDHPEIDRQIDERTVEEAKKDNVLIDARLAGWMAEEADLSILLVAPLDERVQRISEREDVSYEKAMEETRSREESEKGRYKELYGIDVDDYSVFDLILNTGKFNKQAMVEILELAVKNVIENNSEV